MSKLVQLKDKDGNIYPEVYGLSYVENVTIASNITVNANTNTSTATYTLSPRTGYTPVIATVQNTYNGAINLWYINLSPANKTIAWRCRNVSSTNATGVYINVAVLYIKTSAFIT